MVKERAGRLLVIMLLCGLAAGLLWTRGSGISESGSVLGGLAGFALARKRGALRQTLDLFSFGIILAYVVARFGCFLAHDHPGRFSESWIAVRYPEGSRFDLGLLYCIAAMFTALGATMIDRKGGRPGDVFAWTATMLGATRLAVLPLGEPGVFDWIVATGVTSVGIATAIGKRRQ